jgi:glycosyltransferase involved in cell wall biosynthesis
MRVLHVTPYFAPAFVYGGPPRSILGLCRALHRLGIGVQVLTTTANGAGELPASLSRDGCYEGVAVRYLAHAFPRRMFGARGLLTALREEVGQCDIVHVHGLWNLPAWLAARQAGRAGVPYVLSPRGMLDRGSLGHHAVRKRMAYWLVERRTLAGAALLHATSPAEALTLEARGLGVPIAIVPNGVDIPARARHSAGVVRRRLGLPGQAPLIVFLGRIHPAKRLDLLAGAFERVRAAGMDAHLVIAGPDELGHRRRVEPAFAASAPLVRWTGELGDDDKWALLADASALVLCSDSESFGMSVLEALAVAVPVVVTRTCPWKDVDEFGCGHWVPQNSLAIAEGLLHLLAHPAAARDMGRRGAALVRERYSWEPISRAMAERYESVLAGAARPTGIS